MINEGGDDEIEKTHAAALSLSCSRLFGYKVSAAVTTCAKANVSYSFTLTIQNVNMNNEHIGIGESLIF